MRKNFILCDHHQVGCLGICSMLREMYPSCRTRCTQDFYSVYEEVESKHYDLLICEINLPGLPNLSNIMAIKNSKPLLKILIFSSYNEEIFSLRFIKEGVDGFISKKRGLDDLQYAIRLVMQNNKYISPEIVDHLIDERLLMKKTDHYGFWKLSNREFDVAVLLAQGQGLLEISNILDIHVSTVSTYKIRIFQKLQISAVAHLVNYLGQFPVPN